MAFLYILGYFCIGFFAVILSYLVINKFFIYYIQHSELPAILTIIFILWPLVIPIAITIGLSVLIVELLAKIFG